MFNRFIYFCVPITDLWWSILHSRETLNDGMTQYNSLKLRFNELESNCIADFTLFYLQ